VPVRDDGDALCGPRPVAGPGAGPGTRPAAHGRGEPPAGRGR
jgi:hypothetical protein